MKLRTLAVAGGVVVLIAAIVAGAWLGLRPASAEATGQCDVASYELSAEADDDLLELDFELRSAGPGETWQVVVEHNDEPILDTERVTDEEAELDVDLDQRPTGNDRFQVTATPEDGEPCVASLTHDN